MNTCKTCKYWSVMPSTNTDPSGEISRKFPVYIRQCSYVEPLWDHADIEYSTETTDEWKIRETEKLAFALDGEEYMAKLLTKADFGCNRWELAP